MPRDLLPFLLLWLTSPGYWPVSTTMTLRGLRPAVNSVGCELLAWPIRDDFVVFDSRALHHFSEGDLCGFDWWHRALHFPLDCASWLDSFITLWRLLGLSPAGCSVLARMAKAFRVHGSWLSYLVG